MLFHYAHYLLYAEFKQNTFTHYSHISHAFRAQRFFLMWLFGHVIYNHFEWILCYALSGATWAPACAACNACSTIIMWLSSDADGWCSTSTDKLHYGWWRHVSGQCMCVCCSTWWQHHMLGGLIYSICYFMVYLP